MLNKFLQKIAHWGLDSDGDLGLRIGPFVFCFYKYKGPTVLLTKQSGWAPFKDTESKPLWRHIRHYVEEQADDLSDKRFKDSIALVRDAVGDVTVAQSKPRPANPKASDEFIYQPTTRK